ncbi:MAG: hypothetical protein KC589_11340, partial [Nanoarchaeota archaeon]|nr:hypothetical protein [Nanoarchaeota archaeon]
MTLGGEYNLTTNIVNVVNNTCFIFSVNDTVLNCNGNTIDGDNINSDIGVYAEIGSEIIKNLTLKNCNFNDWLDKSLQIGGIKQMNIFNVSINNSNVAIQIIGSNISMNKISATNIGTTGLTSSFSVNITINNSIFFGGGIRFAIGTTGLVENVNITGASEGIRLDANPFNGKNIIVKNSNYGFYVTGNLFGGTINLSNSQFLNSSYEDMLNYDFVSNACSRFYLNNITLSGQYPFGWYNSQVNLSNQIFSSLILCNASNSILNNIEIIGNPTLRNNGFHIMKSDNLTLNNIISKNVYSGISIERSNNISINNINLENVSSNTYLYFSNNILIENMLTSRNNNFGGTFYFNLGKEGDYTLKNKSSFSTDYQTKFISLGKIDNLVDAEKLFLKIEQKNKDFAGIEYLKLKVCDIEYLPKKAYFEKSKKDILFDLFFDDLNIAVANEENIIIEFDSILDCTDELNQEIILEMKANEHNKPMPLNFPKDKSYYNYIKTNITIIPNIDGKINEVDNL